MTVTEIKAKTASEVLELSTDYAVRIVPLRAPGVTYAIGDVSQPADPNGVFYVCIEAGVSATLAPRWSRSGEVRDGTVVWAARPLGDASLPSITAAVWSASTTGIAISGQALAGYRARALVSGGAVGAHYDVDVVITLDTGSVITKRHKIEIL